jgi:hypothetical protein
MEDDLKIGEPVVTWSVVATPTRAGFENLTITDIALAINRNLALTTILTRITRGFFRPLEAITPQCGREYTANQG